METEKLIIYGVSYRCLSLVFGIKKAVFKPLFLIVLTLNYLTTAFSSPLVYLEAIVSSDNALIFEAWPAEPKAS